MRSHYRSGTSTFRKKLSNTPGVRVCTTGTVYCVPVPVIGTRIKRQDLRGGGGFQNVTGTCTFVPS